MVACVKSLKVFKVTNNWCYFDQHLQVSTYNATRNDHGNIVFQPEHQLAKKNRNSMIIKPKKPPVFKQKNRRLPG